MGVSVGVGTGTDIMYPGTLAYSFFQSSVCEKGC